MTGNVFVRNLADYGMSNSWESIIVYYPGSPIPFHHFKKNGCNISLCLPWQTEQNRTYDFAPGFQYETEDLEWDTRE